MCPWTVCHIPGTCMTRFHRQWLPIMSPAFHPQFQHRPQFFVRLIPTHMEGDHFCQTGLIRNQSFGDHTILDSVEGVVDHRRMPDTDSDSTESVQFPLTRCQTWKHFVRKLMSRKSRFQPRWPRRMFMDGLRSLDGVDIRQIFRRRALSSCKVRSEAC